MKEAPRESQLTSICSFFTREADQPTKEVMQMTAETQPAGAASHQEKNWHTINWQAVNQEVKRLQVRIVKAQQQGKRGKVKALQHLLTHSLNGKGLAVKRVTENQGKRTPGVDGAIWNTPQKKAAALETLTQRGYRPGPLRRISLPKSNGSQRPLSIPTMKDRAMQALSLLALDPIAESLADPNSYGLRKDRSPADALAQCHTVLSNRAGAAWILEADLKERHRGHLLTSESQSRFRRTRS
jgi:RNA-directed DNA polymerase